MMPETFRLESNSLLSMSIVILLNISLDGYHSKAGDSNKRKSYV